MSRNYSINHSHIATYAIDDDCLMIDINYLQVQPDVSLLQNMEDNEDNESKESEPTALGKLEYALDYDFHKQEV